MNNIKICDSLKEAVDTKELNKIGLVYNSLRSENTKCYFTDDFGKSCNIDDCLFVTNYQIDSILEKERIKKRV